MRDLEFRDAFTVARLIKKTKIKDTLPEIIRKGKEDGTSVEGIGVDAFLCILEGAGEEGVENEVAKFLADVTEQDAESYKKKKLTDEEREQLEWYEMDRENLFDPEYCDIEYFKEIAEDYNDASQS